MNHNFKVYDTDPFFMVDAATRAIKNMSQTKVAVMQGDHKSERFTFQLPRYIEEHDMMEVDKVVVHFLNVGKDQTKGVYTVDDLSINDEDESTVKCSWLLTKAATAHTGKLSFLIRFVCFAEDGITVDYEWNTAIFSGISVGEGMDCSDIIDDEKYIDIIEQWKTELKAELKGWIDDEVASQVDLVQIQKNTQNIETLTEEHNLMKAKVDNFGKLNEGSTTADAELIDIRVDHEGNTFDSAGDAVREASRKAAQSVAEIAEINARAIISKAEGKYPTVTDSASETNFKGLKIYGRTDQVKTSGANLFDAYDFSYTSQGNRCIAETRGEGAIRVSVNNPSDYMNANVFVIKTASLEVGKVLYATANIAKGDEGNVPGLALYAYNTTTKKGVTIISNIDSNNTGKARCAVKLTEAHITNYDEIRILFYYNSSSSVGWQVGDYVDFSNIMISTSDVPYEPYTGLAPSPSPEYPQALNTIAGGGSVVLTVAGGDAEPKTAIFSTPNGLPGIPVESGGNYTDESGQMWMADEVDCEKGVYIQRVKKIVDDGTLGSACSSHANGQIYHTIKPSNLKRDSAVLSERYIAKGWSDKNNNIYCIAETIVVTDSRFTSSEETLAILQDEKNAILYELAEPIETSLTEEEIAAYKAMKTHKPVTTIINDADAHIEADYVADTKTYIDNKFAELASVIVNNS